MKSDLINTYREECKTFSIEKFYKDEVDSKALIFISPIQKINLNIPRYMNHTNILKQIYYMLYDDTNYYNYKDLWFNVVPKRCDIVISLTDIGVIEVVIPDNINTWQFERFIDFKNEIESINKEFMYVFIDSKEEDNVKDINECMKKLYSRINNNIKTNENNLFTNKVKRL